MSILDHNCFLSLKCSNTACYIVMILINLYCCCSGPDLEFPEAKCSDHDAAIKLFTDTAEALCDKSVPDIKPGGVANSVQQSQISTEQGFEEKQSPGYLESFFNIALLVAYFCLPTFSLAVFLIFKDLKYFICSLCMACAVDCELVWKFAYQLLCLLLL